jgi:hypothetical protein
MKVGDLVYDGAYRRTGLILELAFDEPLRGWYVLYSDGQEHWVELTKSTDLKIFS